MRQRVFWAMVLFALAATARLRGQECGFPWTVTPTVAPGGVNVNLCGTLTGCNPHDPQFTVAGNQITVSLTTAELPLCACTQSVIHFNQTFFVSPVPPGSYSVTAQLIDCGQPIVVGSSSITVGTASVIPALDARGLAAFVALIVGVAFWKLREQGV